MTERKIKQHGRQNNMIDQTHLWSDSLVPLYLVLFVVVSSLCGQPKNLLSTKHLLGITLCVGDCQESVIRNSRCPEITLRL